MITASFLLTISLKLIAFCVKSWQLLQRYGSYLKPISLKYQQWQISHSFDAFGLLTWILSEISILSYSSTYNSYKQCSK